MSILILYDSIINILIMNVSMINIKVSIIEGNYKEISSGKKRCKVNKTR